MSSASSRPVLAIEHVDAPVVEFVAELQAALDSTDADVFNRHFAHDVLWGTPFGGVVDGYDELHAIHAQMFGAARERGGIDSRYVIEHVRFLAEDIVIAYVRRISSDHAHVEEPGRADAFDELALFVLVRRDLTWWLAAGQHVPDRRREVYG